MASFVPEHDNILEAVILEIANQHFGIMQARDGWVRRPIGMERGGAHCGPSSFDVGLVQLKLLLRLSLPTGAEERPAQQVMRRRVEMVWVHPNTFLERGSGSIPLVQPHPGHPKLKERRRFSLI